MAGRLVGEESIYSHEHGQFAAGPVVKTYNIVPDTQQKPQQGGIPRAAQRDGSQIGDLISPMHSNEQRQPAPAAPRGPPKPVNIVKANRAAVRDASSINAALKASAADEAAARARPSPARPAPVHRTSSGSGDRHSGGNGVDFVARNREAAAAAGALQAQQRASESAGKAAAGKVHADFGRVPSYLLERKIEAIESEEAAMRAREIAKIPPGMRLLPESERLETLDALLRSKAEVERAMWALPLKVETLGQKRRKDELDARITDIEQGIKVFSRAQVIVRS
ncbi:hypothetical protein FOA52_013634 [Chlamydomonas sp. UWO 241]|nr:hypothetical protein FOA52_013634 [Chlamydomonas sp. UWO 241]